MTDSYISEDLTTVRQCPLSPDAKCTQVQCEWWDNADRKCAMTVLVEQLTLIANSLQHWVSLGVDVNQP
jgi:hypothetical protein